MSYFEGTTELLILQEKNSKKYTMHKIIIYLMAAILFSGSMNAQKPVKIAIAGLSHSHVTGLLKNLDREDIQIVGIYEKDENLAMRYAERFEFDKSLLYGSLEEMLDKTKPEGVVTFTSIYDHLKVVEACAPRGIHVMVEKPLAVSNEHARKMEKMAKEHDIMLLTNYETSWYPSIHKGKDMIRDGEPGELRKVIVYDGHQGPKEIGVNEEFLEWLTDPVLNGGGAVMDFGCYGADIITWLLDGEKPVSVYASLKQYKPDVYPKVDDDATIILNYPELEGVIYASWNWPFNRKDMHIYGSGGYIFQDDSQTLRYRLDRATSEQTEKVDLSTIPYREPFKWFADLIAGRASVGPDDLASLEINLIVVEILEAAKKSHETGKEVYLVE